MSRSGSSAFPLWPLPLAIAALFTVAAHVALWLSIRDGYVEACVPVLEGCASISRAARHGLGNHVFRLMVLPCAMLQRASKPPIPGSSVPYYTAGTPKAVILICWWTLCPEPPCSTWVGCKSN